VTNRWAVVGCRSCHDLAIPNSGAGVNNAAGFAAVRQLPAGYNFAFNSGAAVATEMGDSAICFECHKGRTPGVDVTTLTENPAGTRNYDISYLHYAPSAAVQFGDDSKMVATYPGKSYVGKFNHQPVSFTGIGEAFQTGTNCVDCHNVHTGADVMTTNALCNLCHSDGGAYSKATLAARTEAYSVRLLDAVLAQMQGYASNPGFAGLNSTLKAKITALNGSYPNASFATAQDELMDYIQQRQVYFPTIAIAHAATTWKVFTYEDGPEHGQTHGHGGSWAHNSVFARQVMWDAIEAMGGSTAGLDKDWDGVINAVNR
jgi:hypothetical protein